MNRLTTSLLVLVALVSATAHAADLKYSIAPGFFEESPGGQQLGPCHGGAVIDKAGNIYVTTDTKRGIAVFSPDGKFTRSFGPTQIHALELREENGQEFIYAARPNFNQVLKLTLDGKRVWTMYAPQTEVLEEATFHPCALTVAPDGSIFVADGYGSNYIFKFDKN